MDYYRKKKSIILHGLIFDDQFEICKSAAKNDFVIKK